MAAEQQLQELELAVQYALCGGSGTTGAGAASDAGGKEISEKASRYCDGVKASNDGWRLALQLLVNSQVPEARFFALTVIQEALGPRAGAATKAQAVEDRVLIRTTVLQWITSKSLASEPKYVRTKAAVVLALLLKRDYPGSWPGAFAELASLLAGGAVFVDLYLSVLNAVDEEVVSFHIDRTPEEVARNTAIKDSIRSTSAAVDIANIAATAVTTYRVQLPSLAVKALETISSCIGWFDYRIFDDRFLALLYECVAEAVAVVGAPGASGSSDAEELVTAACQCLNELVRKGIADTSSKLQSLHQMKLVQMLKQVPLDDDDVAEAVGDVVNAFGDQLLDCWQRLGINAHDAATAESVLCAGMLHEVMPLLWVYLSHREPCVGSSVLDFVGSFVQLLKKQEAGGDLGEPVVDHNSFRAACYTAELLQVVYGAIQYPLDFDFGVDDSDDGSLDVHHKKLRKVLVNTCRAVPNVMLQFLCGALSSLQPPLSALPWNQVEAALRLLFHFSEGCVGKSQHLLTGGPFPQMIVALHSSDITQHPHPHVLMLYYELTLRYSKILRAQPQVIPMVMDSLCGPRGLTNPYRPLRARCCYFLTKLVKVAAQEVSSYIDVVVPGIMKLLETQASGMELSEEACINLHEVMGQMIGLNTVPAEKQTRYLDAVLTPLLRQLRQLLEVGPSTNGNGSGIVERDGGKSEQSQRGDAIAQCLAAIASVCKGFRSPKDYLTPLWVQVLEASALALSSHQTHPRVRAKITFLCHCMVPLLGPQLIPHLGPTAMVLVTQGEGKDLAEVASLLGQFALKLPEASFALLDAMLLPIIQRACSLMPAVDSAVQQNHEVLEKMAQVKIYAHFMAQLAHNDLELVFCSPTNEPHFDGLMTNLVEAMADFNDPSLQKTCLSAFTALMKSESKLYPPVKARCQKFVVETVVPASLGCLLSDEFNVKDAVSQSVMNQLGALLHTTRLCPPAAAAPTPAIGDYLVEVMGRVLSAAAAGPESHLGQTALELVTAVQQCTPACHNLEAITTAVKALAKRQRLDRKKPSKVGK
ncbi:unnamed protein product [Chrysoparadoxa australica]